MSVASSPVRLRALGLIALAAVSWGTTGSVTALLVARAEATPLVVGAARMLVAAVLLLLAVALASCRRRAWVDRRRAGVAGGLRVAPGDGRRCLVLGACMAAFQATYFTAVTRAGIAVTALVAICSAPIMIAALAAVLLGERPTRRLALALALGVAGTALLVAAPVAGTTAPRPLSGVALALGAGLAYALYVVVAKAAVARTAPLPLVALTFTVAAVLTAPALATAGAGRQLALGWPWLLYLGAVTTAGAYALHTAGLRSVSAGAAGVASLLEPLTATLLGVVLFGERLGAAGTAGAALLLGALALLAAGERR
jgi:DME family drug/metabolite transporter